MSSREEFSRENKSTTADVEPQEGQSAMPAELVRWTGFLLHRVHEIAKKLYSMNVNDLGLKPVQIGILQVLHFEGPMVQARLAEKLGIDKATAVPNIDELEAAGLVRRTIHLEDARANIVRSTPLAAESFEQIDRANHAATADLLAPLSASERQQLHKLLNRIAEYHATRLTSR